MLSLSGVNTNHTTPDLVAGPKSYYTQKTNGNAVSIDVLVQCTGCKAVETLQFIDGKLSSSRKFFQINNRVYHRCIGNAPCRIFRYHT